MSRIAFLRAACAEAGFPDARVGGPEDNPHVSLLPSAGGVPDEVCWKAFDLLMRMEGRPHACWDCWSSDVDCSHIPAGLLDSPFGAS